MQQLPTEYIVSKFYLFGGSPKFNKGTKNYQASCPICREGKNWLRKRRCYYDPEAYSIRCFNCGWFSTPYKWIKHLTGLSYKEIIEDSLSYDTINVDQLIKNERAQPAKKVSSLPGDCVNIFDEQQVSFYKDNQVICKAIEYIQQRRLDTAINKPKSLYVCRGQSFDKVHDNRIVIPFFDASNNIIFYQSRGFLEDDDRPKYLSKQQGIRSIFNINTIRDDCDDIFIFEGPFNSFFCRNGVAVGGIQENSTIHLSSKQQEQFDIISKFYKTIWVLDSQWIDNASLLKSQKLVDTKQHVFIWPESIGTRFKDFNDLCIALNKDEIKHDFILRNTFDGLTASLKLAEITNRRSNV